MANIGAQAASAVDEKISEFRTLQTELNTHRSDLGTLMAQRNENGMVKQVSIDFGWCGYVLQYYCILLHFIVIPYCYCVHIICKQCVDM